MKKLEDVLRFENPHVIIDCCRKPTRTDKPDTGIGRKDDNVDLYTYQRNVGYLCGMLSGNKSAGINITCKTCHTTYHLSRELITSMYEKAIKEDNRPEASD